MCVSNIGLIVVFASTQLVHQKIPVIFWWRTGVCFKLICLYCMITRAQARKMANNDTATMSKFTGHSYVAPAVWLERYSMLANSKGWNPQQTLNNVGLYLADGPYTWYRQLPAATKTTWPTYKLRTQTNTCSMMDLHGPWEQNWQSVDWLAKNRLRTMPTVWSKQNNKSNPRKRKAGERGKTKGKFEYR